MDMGESLTNLGFFGNKFNIPNLKKKIQDLGGKAKRWRH